MNKLTFKEYLSKVDGCWMGKNIGGTLGAPFEGARGVNNVTFYVGGENQEALPNDDLDLQLVWLKATSVYVPLRFVNNNTIFMEPEEKYDPDFGKNKK